MVRKTPELLALYLDGKLQEAKSYPYEWSENGVPLSIGANPYDRHGMGYFDGVIGGIRISTLVR